MLEVDHQERLRRLLEQTKCQVTLPREWGDYFDRTGHLQATHDDRRRFVRHFFRAKGLLEIPSSLPAIKREKKYAVVYLRDLSRQGISLLHSEQLFPKETCTVWLPKRKIAFSVVRCRRINASCYVIGARLVGV